MPITIAVLNQKGGTGKTTLAINLARAFQLDGAEVMIADTDPQRSSLKWWERQEDFELPVVPVETEAVGRFLQGFPQYDVVIIDGMPELSTRTFKSVEAADLVLLPVRPGAVDLWSVQAVIELIERNRKLYGSPDARFVVSQAIVGTGLSAEVDEALTNYGYPVLAGRMALRVIYAEASGDGSTVLDMEPGGKAADEMREIYAQVKEVIENV